MKIIGITNNYSASGDTPRNYFLMADSSLLKDGKPFFVPDFDTDFKMYPSLVIRICRLGKNIASRFAHRYYDAISIGLNVRAENEFKRLSSQGLAWTSAIAFDASTILGDFFDIENLNCDELNFQIKKNDIEISQWNYSALNAGIDTIIAEISSRFTLKIGDYIYIGIKNEGFEININDHIEAFLKDKLTLSFNVK